VPEFKHIKFNATFTIQNIAWPEHPVKLDCEQPLSFPRDRVACISLKAASGEAASREKRERGRKGKRKILISSICRLWHLFDWWFHLVCNLILFRGKVIVVQSINWKQMECSLVRGIVRLLWTVYCKPYLQWNERWIPKHPQKVPPRKNKNAKARKHRSFLEYAIDLSSSPTEYSNVGFSNFVFRVLVLRRPGVPAFRHSRCGRVADLIWLKDLSWKSSTEQVGILPKMVFVLIRKLSNGNSKKNLSN